MVYNKLGRAWGVRSPLLDYHYYHYHYHYYVVAVVLVMGVSSLSWRAMGGRQMARKVRISIHSFIHSFIEYTYHHPTRTSASIVMQATLLRFWQYFAWEGWLWIGDLVDRRGGGFILFRGTFFFTLCAEGMEM